MATQEDFFGAVASGSVKAVEEMLATDSSFLDAKNADGVGPLTIAIYNHHRYLADRLLSKGVEPTFHDACAIGLDDEIADTLAETPEIVNTFSVDGFTPLALAAAFGGITTLYLLMDKGADVELRTRNARLQVTPLHAAVFGSRARYVEGLLRRGADVNATQPGGFTALHGAAQNGAEDVIAILLAAGADRRMRTDDGRTAADVARDAGHADLAAKLM